MGKTDKAAEGLGTNFVPASNNNTYSVNDNHAFLFNHDAYVNGGDEIFTDGFKIQYGSFALQNPQEAMITFTQMSGGTDVISYCSAEYLDSPLISYPDFTYAGNLTLLADQSDYTGTTFTNFENYCVNVEKSCPPIVTGKQ